MKILLALLLVILLAGVILAIKYSIKFIQKCRTDYISFRESLALTELPIITFYQNGKKINFVLDTGSTMSVVNEKSLKGLKHTLNDSTSTAAGLDGKLKEGVKHVNITIEYKDKMYTEIFQVLNLTELLTMIKESTGVSIHGILGTSFMQKYKYVLDFKEMIAYSKK